MLAPLLIVDRDSNFYESIVQQAKSGNLKTLSAFNAREARFWIEDGGWPFSGIFLSPQISDQHGLDLVRLAHERRATMPIHYLLGEGDEPPISRIEMRKAGIQGSIRKPASYQDLVRQIAPVAESIDAEPDPSPLDTGPSVILGSDELVPIRSRNFLSGTRSMFDLYVGIGKDRFVKILHQSESFEVERLANVISKGCEWFYIRKESQMRYMDYCDRLAKGLIQNKTIPANIAAEQLCHLGDLTLSVLKEKGLEAAECEYLYRFTRSLTQIVEQSRWGQKPEFQEFLKSLAHYNHGVATAMIASLICSRWLTRTSRLNFSIGLSALLHDIGLGSDWPVGLEDHPEDMTPAQKQIFLDHPVRSAAILKKVSGIEAGVLQAVSQHHERRDGKGFPLGLDQSQIHRFAEVFSLADEMSHAIVRAHVDPRLNPFELASRDLITRYSTPIANVFWQLFSK